jgi:hypothetical protein
MRPMALSRRPRPRSAALPRRSRVRLFGAGTAAQALNESCDVDPDLLKDLGGKAVRNLGETQQLMHCADVALVGSAGLGDGQRALGPSPCWMPSATTFHTSQSADVDAAMGERDRPATANGWI